MHENQPIDILELRLSTRRSALEQRHDQREQEDGVCIERTGNLGGYEGVREVGG